MIPASPRLRLVHSDIRGPLYQEALRMEAEGTPVLKLNTGNPGKFGFTLPDSLREALLAGIDKAVPYCDLQGMKEAREAICAYHRGRGLSGIDPSDVFITNGVSEAASMLLTALLAPGDEILLPTPCYSLWSNHARICGAQPVFYRCDPLNGWNPDIEDIRAKVTKNTRALLIINPNNPTGAVYSRNELLALAQVAREKHLVVIADEIYDRLVMDDIPHHTMAELAPDLPCVTLNGLSKSHVVCGFRCGWMVVSHARDEMAAVKDGIMKQASLRLCGNALTQLVIPAALMDRQSTLDMIVPGGRLFAQREAVCSVLDGIKGLSYVKNRAAFYLFPGLAKGAFDFADGNDFALKLLREKQILVIPGEGFEWQEDLRFRIVMLPEADRLRQAMVSLGDFLDEHRA